MWSNEKVLRFIKDIQANPCLWDVRCSDNKNRIKKFDTIEFLANKYGTSSSEIEKKMLNLKSQFRRERRKIFETKKSGGSPKRPSWFAYEALIFLAKQKSKGSRGTVTEEQKEEDFPIILESTTADNKEVQESFEGYSNCSFQNKTNYADENDVTFPTKKLNKSTVENNDVGILEAFTCMKTLVSIASQRDKFSVYGEHIANKLRNSGKSREEIAVAQHHIDQICFNLDMNVYSHKNNFGSGKDVQYNPTTNCAVTSEHSCSSTYMTSPTHSEDIVKPTQPKKRAKKNHRRNPESDAASSVEIECDVKSETDFTEELWDDTVLRYPNEVEETTHDDTGSGHQIFLQEVQPKLEPEEEMDSL